MASLFERLDAGRLPPAEEKIKQPPTEQPRPLPTEKKIKQSPSDLELAQRLLNWLQRWNKPTVCIRDIHIYGPGSIRNKKNAVNAAEVLVNYGWLTPLKPHRYDMRKWRIIRRPPIVAPEVAM
jgi:hypothetical protein